jgi:hypothetical protein
MDGASCVERQRWEVTLACKLTGDSSMLIVDLRVLYGVEVVRPI